MDDVGNGDGNMVTMMILALVIAVIMVMQR